MVGARSCQSIFIRRRKRDIQCSPGAQWAVIFASIAVEEHRMAPSDATPTSLTGIGVSPGLIAGPVARMAPGITEPEIATPIELASVVR